MTAPLFETDNNPIPAGMRADYLRLANGRSRCFVLLKDNERMEKKGTVIILHGRNECIEKYFETMSDLDKRGFDTITFDWLGQGGSERVLKDPVRGYINSFDDYVDQFDQFFQNIILPDCRGPFFILAHSTGSLVALLASPMLANRVQRMVLCAPLLGLINQPFSHNNLYRLSGFLKFIGFGGAYMGGGPRPRETLPFEGNRLTSDLNRYTRNSTLYEQQPHLALGSQTVSWVYAACKAINRVLSAKFKATMQVPTLIIAAGADKIVSNQTLERFIIGMRSTALITIDGASHEILQEQDFYREQALSAFDAFVPGSV